MLSAAGGRVRMPSLVQLPRSLAPAHQRVTTPPQRVCRRQKQRRCLRRSPRSRWAALPRGRLRKTLRRRRQSGGGSWGGTGQCWIRRIPVD